jgi:hypothetical protein
MYDLFKTLFSIKMLEPDFVQLLQIKSYDPTKRIQNREKKYIFEGIKNLKLSGKGLTFKETEPITT